MIAGHGSARIALALLAAPVPGARRSRGEDTRSDPEDEAPARAESALRSPPHVRRRGHGCRKGVGWQPVKSLWI